MVLLMLCLHLNSFAQHISMQLKNVTVKQAIENAIGTWQQYQKLCNSNAMMQSLIRSSSNQYLILDLEGRCHYSTVNDEKEEEFIQSLQKELGKCRTSSRRSFFITL